MGRGYDFTCKNCGTKFSAWTGSGFLYPLENAEIVEKVKAGEYGKELQKVLLETDDAFLDSEKHLYTCSCGCWSVETAMDVYAPDVEANNSKKSEREYVFGMDLDKTYTLVWHQSYMCKCCGKPMRKIKNVNSYMRRYGLPCPSCRTRHKVYEAKVIDWD